MTPCVIVHGLGSTKGGRKMETIRSKSMLSGGGLTFVFDSTWMENYITPLIPSYNETVLTKENFEKLCISVRSECSMLEKIYPGFFRDKEIASLIAEITLFLKMFLEKGEMILGTNCPYISLVAGMM